MDDDGATRGPAGEDQTVSTFFCRDCQRYFQSEPCSADGECAPCPHCQSDCYTVEFEESERQRLQNEDTIVSFFAGILGFASGGFLPSWRVREVDDLPPNPLETTGQRSPLSPQFGELVRTYFQGKTLDEFETDRHVWAQYLSASGRGGAEHLLDDVNALLDMPPAETFEAVNALCPGGNRVFIYPPSELIGWLKELKTFLEHASPTDAC
jgi:hypothetical protein